MGISDAVREGNILGPNTAAKICSCTFLLSPGEHKESDSAFVQITLIRLVLQIKHWLDG